MTEQSNEKNAALGTFAGVFTPSVLTILGIILFLRLGYVVGSAGLGEALIIICIANLISVLTSFSLAAIATNMKVKGGGDYYLISRTLGAEFGGAIGIVLFLAQSVSIAFYCIGFGEALNAILAGKQLIVSAQIIAFAALCFLFILAYLGADLATKFQYVVMAFLTLALISFYTGAIEKWDFSLLSANWASPRNSPGFWILFALFFPAVTGFTQGVSMSGDLEDPGKSLPFGTFLAVFVSILVYFSVAVLFAASTPISVLANDYGTMNKTASFGFLIDAGVICATLSSAMASFLGAPRILQSLASDKIFPFLNRFAKGEGPANNPRRGVLLSLGIAAAVIALGQLDLIARVVSMFFLISYGLLNYATYFEAAAASPSFRPRFKWYHRHLSLAGFLACAGVMLAIDIKTGIAACGVLMAIYQYLKAGHKTDRWVDSQRSYHLQQVRKHLMAAGEDMEHARQWRPYILAFSNQMATLENLLFFSNMIEGGSGMTTAVRIVQGSGYRMASLKDKIGSKLKKMIANKNFRAFPRVISAVDTENALSLILQAYGIGPVTANTLVFDYDEINTKAYFQIGEIEFRQSIKSVLYTGCNMVLVKSGPFIQNGGRNDFKQIDVWWQADDSSRLALLLAFLTTRSEVGKNAKIRLFAVNYDRENNQVIQELAHMLEDVRVDAESKIVLSADSEQVVTISGQSDLVFLPASIRQEQFRIFDRFESNAVLPTLKRTAFVFAGTAIDLDSDPEEGRVKELVMIHDELEHAEKRAALAQKAAREARSAADERMKAIQEEMPDTGADLKAKIKEMLSAKKNADATQQKAMREQVKLAAVRKKAADEGIAVDSPESDSQS